MNKQIILKRFIAFLKVNGVYKSYIDALKKGNTYRVEMQWDKNPIQFIVNILDEPVYLINRAFNWSSSTVNWFHLSIEWVDILRRELKININK